MTATAGKVVTIHQPEHIPWLGFFDKLIRSDLVVFLDNVPFRKNYFQNRNRVRTIDGWSWVTVPVHHRHDTLIRDVTIANRPGWAEKWWKTIFYSYRKARYFEFCFDPLKEAVAGKWHMLADLNILLIETLCGFMDIDFKYMKASWLDAEGSGSGLILDICQKTGAQVYLSGISGRDYLDDTAFRDSGVAVEYQEFHHPVYRQLYEPFEPCMGVVDLLMNYGPDSKRVIQGEGVEVMDKLYL